MDNELGSVLGYVEAPMEGKSNDLQAELNSLFESIGIETISQEKMAALMTYMTEHQADRWTELIEFFINELSALFREAMENVS